MRKQLINIGIIVILSFSIYGCSQTAEDVSMTKTETVESQSAEAEKEEASTQGDQDKQDEAAIGEGHDQGENEAAALDDTEPELFTYIIDDNRAVVTGLQAEYKELLQEDMPTDREIEIPDTMGGCPVVEIGDHAFENIKMNRAVIPETVEVIGNSAFKNTGIEDANLSECYELKEVKDYAFENCNLQARNHFVWFMEKIGERAFAGNKQLTRVNFWSGDVMIGKDAFENCGDEMLFFLEWSREETGKEVEKYAAANGIRVEYPVTTQIRVPAEPLLLTPEIGSFFYGTLGGTYDDLEEDLFCSLEKAPDAPNFGYEDWQWIGCSRWCQMNYFANQATASSELESASDRYQANNVVSENRELAWAEGAEGAGIGEYIIYDQIVFSHGLIESSDNMILRAGDYGYDGYIDYTQICIVNGYARNEEVWQENGRVKTFMMYVCDQPYARLELEDTINPQYFTIPQGDIRVANGEEVSFKFVIEEVYPGTMYEDTCITGIVVDFGNVADGH